MINTSEPESATRKQVVTVGAGFAGLNCARELASHSGVRITLIGRHNNQQFQQLLYQVATAILSPENAGFALRNTLCSDSKVDVKIAEVTSVDLKTGTAVIGDSRTKQGEFLVLAAGSQVNFFDALGTEPYAFPLYSLRDAEKLRSRLLAVFESVDRDPSLIEKGALTFGVIGAGSIGVETADVL